MIPYTPPAVVHYRGRHRDETGRGTLRRRILDARAAAGFPVDLGRRGAGVVTGTRSEFLEAVEALS